jgi:hypothetical protein
MGAIFLALSVFKGAPIANADTIAVPAPSAATKTVVYAVEGATLDGSHPPDSVEGDVITKWVDSPIRPLSMAADNAAATEKMVAEVKPDADGVCNIAGVSSGSVVAYNAAKKLAATCPVVNLTLQASPIGPGSVQSLLPQDNPLIQFPQLPLPTNVHARHIVWDGDGYASCPGLQDWAGCAAGVAVYHYGVAGAPQEIAPPSEYVANGQEYTVKHGANAVGVLLGAAYKAIDPNFKGWNAVDEARFNQMFPKGTPGYDQPGAFTLQGAPNFMAPIQNALGDLVKNPVGTGTAIPQAKAIPAQLNAGTGTLLTDGVKAATSVVGAATAVAGVAAAAQTGNPMGLLQVPQALSNTLTAANDVGQVVNDLSTGIQAPALTPTPAIAPATPAPAVDPVPAVQNAVQSVATQVQDAVSHVAPAPVSVPQVDLGAVQHAAQDFGNTVNQAISGVTAAVPAPAPVPVPALPNLTDVANGLHLLGVG